MVSDEFLTVTEVAGKLRISPYTVRRWLRDGKLKGKMMGGDRGGYRVSASEVNRFMADDRPMMVPSSLTPGPRGPHGAEITGSGHGRKG